jgi:hypothetical protein
MKKEGGTRRLEFFFQDFLEGKRAADLHQDGIARLFGRLNHNPLPSPPRPLPGLGTHFNDRPFGLKNPKFVHAQFFCLPNKMIHLSFLGERLGHFEKKGPFSDGKNLFQSYLGALGLGDRFDQRLGLPSVSIKNLTSVARLQPQNPMEVKSFAR